jgi:hypothetical protein
MKLIDMRLSPNFTVKEAVGTSHKGHTAKNLTYITPEIMLNMVRLSNEVLEPLRMILDNTPIDPDSWLRNPQLNKIVGGSEDSQHLKGGATDFKHHDAWNAFDALGELGVGQRIIYLDGNNIPIFIHASIPVQSWEWWEGKKAWKKPDGKFKLQSQICYPAKKLFLPYTGKRPGKVEAVH